MAKSLPNTQIIQNYKIKSRTRKSLINNVKIKSFSLPFLPYLLAGGLLAGGVLVWGLIGLLVWGLGWKDTINFPLERRRGPLLLARQ